jgi:5'-phosphate synthase pdxT subunit
VQKVATETGAIGVLALQGDVREHLRALERAGLEGQPVKRPAEIEPLAGLIIPGGESTTIGKLMERFGLAEPIRGLAEAGRPIYGTCAGAILLAREIVGSTQFRLGLMDIEIERNAYGRQVDSFETDLEVPGLPGGSLRAVFIRAPVIRGVGAGVEVLARHGDAIVMARQGPLLVSTFHPELTDDPRIHQFLARMARGEG